MINRLFLFQFFLDLFLVEYRMRNVGKQCVNTYIITALRVESNDDFGFRMYMRIRRTYQRAYVFIRLMCTVLLLLLYIFILLRVLSNILCTNTTNRSHYGSRADVMREKKILRLQYSTCVNHTYLYRILYTYTDEK